MTLISPRDFCRISWVSNQARDTWEPLLKEFAEGWRQLEWMSVAMGYRTCAILTISQSELVKLVLLLKGSRVRIKPLSAKLSKVNGEDILLFQAAIGSSSELRHLIKAWQKSDSGAIGELLGYPSCCRQYFEQTIQSAGKTDVLQDLVHKYTDSFGGDSAPNLRLSPELNQFLRCIGVRLLFHLPCSFGCGESQAIGERLGVLANHVGFDNIISCAKQILGWPINWSSLHGIAEIKTPILRISKRTDFSIKPASIKCIGTLYPKEGAKALRGKLVLGET